MSGGENFDPYSLHYVDYTAAGTIDIGTSSMYPTGDAVFPSVTFDMEDSMRVNQTPADFYPGSVSCSHEGAIIPAAAWYEMQEGSDPNCFQVQVQRYLYDSYTDSYRDLVEKFETAGRLYKENEDRPVFDVIGNWLEGKELPPLPKSPTQPPKYKGMYLAYDNTEYTDLLADEDL